jgi:2-polyprenyl-3-methyl-5-hydroxy-6-metoxy-1,4-benzoquinol methylase
MTLNVSDEVNRKKQYGMEVFEHDSSEESARLALIEEEQDPYTIAQIERFGIAPTWHCLEIGAGKGSIAYWLADRCPQGRVVATDLDVSLLSSSGRSSLEILRHDITRDDFPADSFDLIHARGVLTHTPDPEALCARLASWLRPGGWLLVADPASFPVDSSPHALMRKAGAASTEVMREIIGTDPNWARTFPAPLLRAGLIAVDAECRLRMMRGGTREARMLHIMLTQLGSQIVATGLISGEELAMVRMQLLDPEFVDFPPALVRAWGQRPPEIAKA